jgi:enterochelin esterase-like enzyme
MDAERWPGGGCEEYMRRLTLELLPLVQREFNTASDPGRVAFGGGSFAGGWSPASQLTR